MATELRYPTFNARTESERALKGYLHQLVDQLQFALNSMETETPQEKATTNDFQKFFENGIGKTTPSPRGRLAGNWNPDVLTCGVYIVTSEYPLMSGEDIIMHDGIIVNMFGTLGGDTKLQLAFPCDESSAPVYRLCWNSTWSNWRSMKPLIT